MVQQAYRLRGRRHPLSAHNLTHDESPILTAVTAAGLKPGVLTLPAEKKRYGGNRSEYLEARDFVLLQWEHDKTRFLTEEACVRAAPDGRQRMVREVYRFLMQQGCINLGFLKDDPLIPLPEGFLPEPKPEEEKEGGGGDGDKEKEKKTEQEEANVDEEAKSAPPPEATDEAIEDKLYEIMSTVDMNITSEKMLRTLLTDYFHVDMGGPRKSLIRSRVQGYLEHSGPPPTYKDAATRAAEAAAAAAAADAEAEKRKKAEQHRRARSPLGRVVVIGAGPAGLAAALHLKRNNVEVTVVEARGRVGGRVNSHHPEGFGAPLDLGASIITGIEADALKGLRPDPSALLCAQLGVPLHVLQSDKLPLHDGVTGGVAPKELDDQVERLRDEMLDDVADFLDEMSLEEQEKASFGGLLEKSWGYRGRGEVPPSAAVAAAKLAAIAAEEAETAAISAAAFAASNGGGENGGMEVGDAEMAVAVVAVAVEETKNEDKKEEDGEDAGGSIPPRPLPTTTTVEIETVAGAEEQEEDEGKKEEEKLKIETDVGNDTTATITTTTPATVIDDVHLRFLNWHWANLEYGCSAPLSALSAKHWNQDEEVGGFGGPHCMVVGGYQQPFRRLASLLDVRLNTPAHTVKLHEGVEKVEVITGKGNEKAGAGEESFWCDAVVVTVPLGILKTSALTFEPPLPQYKQECIERLGFGDLNKVILQFDRVFWDDGYDFFGAAKGTTSADRGFCFMWWNFHRFTGVPILAALVSGESAHAAETMPDKELQAQALTVLRAMHPGVDVPPPVACHVSRWNSEEYTRGSYSYVAVGASGEDYDKLAIPVGRRILFAGEHTIKEHPDTVGGAMMSGVREAARALEILQDDKKQGAQEAQVVGQAMAELKRRHAETGVGGGGVVLGMKKKKQRREENGSGGGGGHEEEGGEEEEAGDRGTDVDDEDDDEEDDDGIGGFDRRFDGIMGRDVERMDEGERARKASRAAAKEVWRCLMMAEMGDVTPILGLLQSSSDHHSRQTVANCIHSASSQTQCVIAKHRPCVEKLTTWVAEATGEAMHIALLDTLLKCIRTMSVPEVLLRDGTVGLVPAVKRCTTHGDPDIRKIALQIMKIWALDHQHHHHHPNHQGSNGRGSSTPERPFSATATGGPGSRPGSAPSPKPVELDEEAKKQLEEAEAEMKRLEEETAAILAAAEEAGKAKAEALKAHSQVGVVSFAKFQKYQKLESKRQQQHHRHDTTTNNGGGGGGEEEEEFDFGKKVDALVCSVLKRALEERRINSDIYRKIRTRANEKVMSNVRPETLVLGRRGYEKEKKNIVRMTEGYVDAYDLIKRRKS